MFTTTRRIRAHVLLLSALARQHLFIPGQRRKNSAISGGDLMGMPELCITIGMKQILASRKIYIALNRPWQHGPLKHVLLDPEQPQWPATLPRRVKDLQYCMASDIAKGIVTD